MAQSKKPSQSDQSGGLGSSRESRGPDTGGPMEREVCPPGRDNKLGYPGHKRTKEPRQDRDSLGKDFDDDLVR